MDIDLGLLACSVFNASIAACDAILHTFIEDCANCLHISMSLVGGLTARQVPKTIVAIHARREGRGEAIVSAVSPHRGDSISVLRP